MKRLISLIIALITMLSFASCSSDKGATLEDRYYEAAMEYVEKGDVETAFKVIEEGLGKVPDSSKLVGLKEKLNTETETTTEAPAATVPTEDSIIKEFTALRMIYRKWFESYEFEYDEAAGTYDENYMFSAPVRDATVKTKSDLDNLFLKYCNDTLYKTYYERSIVMFRDENGVLYCVMPEAFGYSTTADKDIRVTKLTDTDYQLTYIEEVNDEGDLYSYNVTLAYSLMADGTWKFTTETRSLTEEVTEQGNDVNNSSQKTPNGQQIVEDIVGDREKVFPIF